MGKIAVFPNCHLALYHHINRCFHKWREVSISLSRGDYKGRRSKGITGPEVWWQPFFAAGWWDTWVSRSGQINRFLPLYFSLWLISASKVYLTQAGYIFPPGVTEDLGRNRVQRHGSPIFHRTYTGYFTFCVSCLELQFSHILKEYKIQGGQVVFVAFIHRCFST